MSARSPEDSGPVLQAFLKGLVESGFFDGQNVTIEYRWARGEYGRLPAFAAELVQRRVKCARGDRRQCLSSRSEARNRDDLDRVCGGWERSTQACGGGLSRPAADPSQR